MTSMEHNAEHVSPAQEARGRLTGAEREVAERFEANIGELRPQMFDLAERLVEDYPARQWNVLIGDDTSGRLPARFIRKALASQGIELPMSYIMANSNARNKVPQAVYQVYVESVAEGVGEPMRPLIVSEGVSSGVTLGFVKELLEPVSEGVDVAVVASNKPEVPGLEGMYIGGVGPGPSDKVGETFEKVHLEDESSALLDFMRRVTPNKVKRFMKRHAGGAVNAVAQNADSHELTNLNNQPHLIDSKAPDEGYSPVASLTKDQQYRGLAHYCYLKMDELAEEFGQYYQTRELEKIVEANRVQSSER